jgi:ABC-type multidrug transport system ATPase subunit
MDYDKLDGCFPLRGVEQRTDILGKNGCGKSYVLKRAEQELRTLGTMGKIRYISPERAGTLKYDPGIDNQIGNSPSWINDTRRRNQSENFKQQSAALFRRLEILVLREIERDHTMPAYQPKTFATTVNKINALLDRVEIRRSDAGFEIFERDTGNQAPPEQISSGESEIISLAIEFLSFVHESEPTKMNFLLVDEPDVHLHPDLQDRLAQFISTEVSAKHITIILATHSTALLSSLSRDRKSRIAFMRSGDKELRFADVNEIHQRILPMFGAHPLSNVFNQNPILLVEGEDDERIWQQAVRSSRGEIRAFPCVVDNVDRLHEFETQANNIIESVYDDARGFSLRDRDQHPEEIDDIGHIVRMRLHCRAAENLLLSDDVLALAGSDWSILQDRLRKFVLESAHHPYHAEVKAFVDDGLDRLGADIKRIRNVLVGLFSDKPWEVLVGQAIAGLKLGRGLTGPDSLREYLGRKVCRELLAIA